NSRGAAAFLDAAARTLPGADRGALRLPARDGGDGSPVPGGRDRPRRRGGRVRGRAGRLVAVDRLIPDVRLRRADRCLRRIANELGFVPLRTTWPDSSAPPCRRKLPARSVTMLSEPAVTPGAVRGRRRGRAGRGGGPRPRGRCRGRRR